MLCIALLVLGTTALQLQMNWLQEHILEESTQHCCPSLQASLQLVLTGQKEGELKLYNDVLSDVGLFADYLIFCMCSV